MNDAHNEECEIGSVRTIAKDDDSDDRSRCRQESACSPAITFLGSRQDACDLQPRCPFIFGDFILTFGDPCE